MPGEPLMEALVGGARDRLRAVILTSVTTIFGLDAPCYSRPAFRRSS